MHEQYRLSNVTKDYLTAFYNILDEMICGMTEAELTDSISHNFIVQMIPHHRAAIEMSHNILKYTTCIPLQDIASQIISEQTKSIQNMQNVKYSCQMLNNPKQDLCLYNRRMDQIMKTMFSKMKNACADNQVSADFMREMIPHHQGAIQMSKNALQYNICPELVPILQAIITSQKRGVEQMQRLLNGMKCCRQ